MLKRVAGWPGKKALRLVLLARNADEFEPNRIPLGQDAVPG